MRIGAILSPTADWGNISAAAATADELGLDAVGFWDHYHSGRPEWAYLCGWSLYGALAATTSRVRLLPMVLNNLHYDLGVIAKESSALAIASNGRFELGVGAGDWPESFAAWGRPFPGRDERLALLEESADALRQLWTGDPIDFVGRHIRLTGATCTPAPPAPPRIVVGVARSPRTLERAVRFADEVNVYADEDFVEIARRAAEGSGRDVAVSLYLDWSWDAWPADPAAELARWKRATPDRIVVCVGSDDMPGRVRALAAAA